MNADFKTFKPFKQFQPTPLSFPATRGRMKEGKLNGAQRLNDWNYLNDLNHLHAHRRKCRDFSSEHE